MASGTADAFARGCPVLTSLAAKVHDPGPEAGTGAAIKMVNQWLAGVHIAAACEVNTFARAMDTNIAKGNQVITGSAGNSWMFENRVPHILDRDHAAHSAWTSLPRVWFAKDLGIVSAMGRGRGFPTLITATMLQRFVMTAAVGMGRNDDVSVARMLVGLALPARKG